MRKFAERLDVEVERVEKRGVDRARRCRRETMKAGVNALNASIVLQRRD
jgi:hypothetical protein